MSQDRLKVGLGFVGLAPGAAGAGAKILEDEVDFAVQAIERHDRRRVTHTQLHASDRKGERPQLWAKLEPLFQSSGLGDCWGQAGSESETRH